MPTTRAVKAKEVKVVAQNQAKVPLSGLIRHKSTNKNQSSNCLSSKTLARIGLTSKGDKMKQENITKKQDSEKKSAEKQGAEKQTAPNFTKDTTLGEVLKVSDKAQAVLMGFGMHCFGCPMAQMETLEEAAQVHDIELDFLLEKLNEE